MPSRVSSATSSPSSTSTIGGMSGCQRLCPVSGCSARCRLRSIEMVFMHAPLSGVRLIGVGWPDHLMVSGNGNVVGKDDMASPRRIYELTVVLREVAPPVWRAIQVPEEYSFWDLHVAIQDAMG